MPRPTARQSHAATDEHPFRVHENNVNLQCEQTSFALWIVACTRKLCSLEVTGCKLCAARSNSSLKDGSVGNSTNSQKPYGAVLQRIVHEACLSNCGRGG
jgi:hypothetical protein